MAKHEPIEFNKTGHIVVLDQSWHALFANNKSVKLKMLENKLNKLLKEQGKVNDDYKRYQVLKKQMMAEIVENMDAAHNKKDVNAEATLKKNEKYIKEINANCEKLEQKKIELPNQIEAVNKTLLTQSLAICYEEMVKHKKQKSILEKEIDQLHKKVKQMVGEKEDMDSRISQLYQYMHDIAGIDIIEQYDRMYFGEENEK